MILHKQPPRGGFESRADEFERERGYPMRNSLMFAAGIAAAILLLITAVGAESPKQPASEVAALTEGRTTALLNQQSNSAPRFFTFDCFLIGERRPAHCFEPERRKVEPLPEGCRIIPCDEGPRGNAEVVQCPLGKEPAPGTAFKQCSP